MVFASSAIWSPEDQQLVAAQVVTTSQDLLKAIKATLANSNTKSYLTVKTPKDSAYLKGARRGFIHASSSLVQVNAEGTVTALLHPMSGDPHVGEAPLSPAAYSMIGDSFPRERLGRALAVYNTGISVGSALALILGGLVVNAVTQDGASYTLPLLGEVRAWQIVFIVTGAPGLLLCFLIFTVREPLRRGLLRVASGAVAAPVRFAETLRFTWERRSFYLVFFVAVGLLSVIGYGYLGWLPVALNRRFGMPIGDLAIINGVFTLLLNTTGIFMAGRVADALAARGVRDAALRVCVFIAAWNAFWGTLGLLMPTLRPAPAGAFASR